MDSIFTNNSAPTNCGGGVYVITGVHLHLSGNTFIDNEAASGGGVRSCLPRAGSLTVQAVLFICCYRSVFLLSSRLHVSR